MPAHSQPEGDLSSLEQIIVVIDLCADGCVDVTFDGRIANAHLLPSSSPSASVSTPKFFRRPLTPLSFSNFGDLNFIELANADELDAE